MEITPKYESMPCPWTPGNPRHDHQLIFQLDEERLLLVWCEYYIRKPSRAFGTVHDRVGELDDDAPCQIMGRISKDKGRTWSDKIALQENIWLWNVKHPNIIRSPNGDLTFFMTVWESNAARNMYMKRSADNGETWSHPEQISEPGWYCNNNDHILRLKSGRIILPAHGGPDLHYQGGRNDTGKDDKTGEFKTVLHSFVFYSDDEFKTWKVSDNTMTAPGRGCHEPTIVELNDGRLLCFMRTTLKRIYKSYSEDGGVTWSTPEPTELTAPDSPPLLKRIPATGDLMLVWNNIDSDSNQPRVPLTVAISKDEGETWGNIQDIDGRNGLGGQAAYAAVTFVDDEALVTYYYRGDDWGKGSAVKLKIYDIDQFYS